MKVKITGKWESYEANELLVYYRGSKEVVVDVVAELHSSNFSSREILNILKRYSGSTTAIIIHPKYIIAWVDHIRSWPIFYTERASDNYITDDVSSMNKNNMDIHINQGALVEFCTSGYVSGSSTILKDVRCLEPGDLMFYNFDDENVSIYKHFDFRPNNSYVETTNYEAKSDEFEKLLNTIFDEIIEHAKKLDARIWVPLSAGLDSRLILVKLLERNCTNVGCFTYGPYGNFEASKAKNIARKLSVEWHRVQLTAAEIREIYNDEATQRYINSAFQYKAVPAFGGFFAIFKLKKLGIFKSGDIVINGQSGDFISGGHLSNYLSDQNVADENIDEQLKLFINKHYSLLRNFDDQLKKTELYSRLLEKCNQNTNNLLNILDQYEYNNRQCSYVVNAQRIYENFDLSWELPLWDKRIVNFFETLPLDYRLNQKFYKTFLADKNYFNQFSGSEKNILRFPVQFSWIIIVGKLIHAICGQKIKNEFYRKMKYFGHYSDQYCVYNFQLHKQLNQFSNNVVGHRVIEVVNTYFPIKIIKALQLPDIKDLSRK